MREGFQRPDTANPYFPWQLTDLARRVEDAQVGEGGSFLDVPGTGMSRNPILDTVRAYEITDSDGMGRYAGTPVVHTESASPSSADTFVEDGSGRMGPDCSIDPLTFPLIEVTLNATVPVGSRVLAWPSPASDAMLFSAGSASLSVVRAVEDGETVDCYLQTRTLGAWEDVGDLISVSILNDWREPFFSGSRYLAVQVNGDWFAETGPKSLCLESIVPGTLTCGEDGGFEYDTVWVRVLARPGCDPTEQPTFIPQPPTDGPPVMPARSWRGDGSGRHSGSAAQQTGVAMGTDAAILGGED